MITVETLLQPHETTCFGMTLDESTKISTGLRLRPLFRLAAVVVVLHSSCAKWAMVSSVWWVVAQHRFT